ncbi:hypothetical protein Y032_0277g1127 [Ancylostoma ceylanicum]|uniref:Uncharacterized protein n=1 Tax=Ancylostoma ceylanicum TaxID=53326 RepID=A0A016S804_9BILA|nr:hypothetical protein Y032_0277g1127 [Ancylostoma ceylanicum]
MMNPGSDQNQVHLSTGSNPSLVANASILGNLNMRPGPDQNQVTHRWASIRLSWVNLNDESGTRSELGTPVYRK